MPLFGEPTGSLLVSVPTELRVCMLVVRCRLGADIGPLFTTMAQEGQRELGRGVGDECNEERKRKKEKGSKSDFYRLFETW